MRGSLLPKGHRAATVLLDRRAFDNVRIVEPFPDGRELPLTPRQCNLPTLLNSVSASVLPPRAPLQPRQQ